MKNLIIVYASHDGQTQKISNALGAHLRETGVSAKIIAVEDCTEAMLADSDIIVFGAPIRYGKHLPVMVNFLQQHRTVIDDKITAFFSVNLTARKAHRNTPKTSNYTKKLFKQLDWQPDEADVFAGKIDYSAYGFFDTLMIRFIMWMTKGPTDPNTVQEFTDWQRVTTFAKRLASLAKPSA